MDFLYILLVTASRLSRDSHNTNNTTTNNSNQIIILFFAHLCSLTLFYNTNIKIFLNLDTFP